MPPTAEAAIAPGAERLDRETLRALLADTRAGTLALVAGLADADLDRVHSPLMSPLAWDLGHIAAFEDLWLCRAAGGLELLRPDLARVYDADETPRPRRGELPFLRAAEVRGYMEAVRERSLALLDETADDGSWDLWDMVVRHEQQHCETMLQTLTLAGPNVWSAARSELTMTVMVNSLLDVEGPEMVRIEAGPFERGAPAGGFAYDNERPRQVVELPAFEIDRLPVTVGDWIEFVEATGAAEPLHWNGTPPDERLPVVHVSWHEAEAYARFRGKRLPTEAEWEKAAAWDPATGESRRWPWGDEPPTPERANVGRVAFAPAPAGSRPAGASATGLLGLIGDCWEWTASEFAPYPGFRAHPYREYSEVFFGQGYRVLRGGSWASGARAVDNRFRNWDRPERRQLFAGLRCAA